MRMGIKNKSTKSAYSPLNTSIGGTEKCTVQVSKCIGLGDNSPIFSAQSVHLSMGYDLDLSGYFSIPTRFLFNEFREFKEFKLHN